MLRQYLHADSRLLPGSDINEAHNPRVPLPANDNQLTKVLVECHEHSVITPRAGQYLLVPWIVRPISSPDDIMPRGGELIGGATPDTSVEKKLHSLVITTNGSTRSWPTSRRA